MRVAMLRVRMRVSARVWPSAAKSSGRKAWQRKMCIRDSIYNKALTSDEVLNNYIVDRNHLEDADGEPGVRSLDEDNRVLNE